MEQTEQPGVFVIGMTGKRLMPTTPAKARKLLEAGKATVYQKRPYTIKLNYKTGGAVQDCCLGIDTGSQHIGVALVRLDTADPPAAADAVAPDAEVPEKQPAVTAVPLHAAEITLRSTMEKRKLMEKRKEYRKGRRHRKVRHRHPKFRHRTKRVCQEEKVKRETTKHETHWKKETAKFDSGRPEGWLPPSIQSKVDQHIEWIRRYLDVVPEGTVLGIELGRFDVQRMKDPQIHGELYQRGPQYDYENLKAYVFARDSYTCQVCGKKLGSADAGGRVRKGRLHHILYRSCGATDRPDMLLTVCTLCHQDPAAHAPGGKLFKLKEKAKPVTREYRDATFMNIMAKRLREAFPDAWFTWGNITNADRNRFMLPKTHANDAVAIAAHSADGVAGSCGVLYYRQVRSKKRSLYEATPRKGKGGRPNREAARNRKNTRRSGEFQIWDKVSCRGQTGWISGFSDNGKKAYLQDENGRYLKASDKVYADGSPDIRFKLTDLVLLHHNNNWLVTGKQK